MGRIVVSVGIQPCMDALVLFFLVKRLMQVYRMWFWYLNKALLDIGYADINCAFTATLSNYFTQKMYTFCINVSESKVYKGYIFRKRRNKHTFHY